MARRSLSELLDNLDEAIDVVRELIACGGDRWEQQRPLRLAGEAVIGPIGDVASKLPDKLLEETRQVPWDGVRGMRIVVDHVYHAVDYNIVWQTLRDDVPNLGNAIDHWRVLHPEHARSTERDWG